MSPARTLIGQFLVAGFQCLRGIKDGLFDQTAHFHDPGLNAFKVAVEGA